MAIRWPGGTSHYYAWGHPTENNCSKADAARALGELWSSGAPLLFFNAKFDLDVATSKLHLPMPSWDRVHDAMFLAFLADPHSRDLDLKTLAETLLNWPPEERDAVAEWVWEHRQELVEAYGGKVTRAKSGPNSAGAWLSRVPAKLVGEYAIGDVDRTHGLFAKLLPLIKEVGMLRAYNRERQFLPIIMENERDGIRVDLDGLERDVPKLQKSMLRAENHIRRKLNSRSLNVDADRELAEALSREGVVRDEDWTLTPTGQKSVSKDNLSFDMFQDQEVGHLLFYRNRLQTALKMFLEPWLEQGSVRNGYISTNWNQVRGGSGGTRTGRPSTNNPNFLNIPKEFDEEFSFPDDNPFKVKPLPFVRKYILPDPGEVFMHRDFDSQEIRVFAHFEDGEMCEAFNTNPDLDPHKMVGDNITRLVGLELQRKDIKILNFQALYGGGVPAAANKLKCSLADAKRYKQYHDKALPGRKQINDEINRLVRRGIPIVTWGGRRYFVEPPMRIKGKVQTFEYKLINYLIQGSAADITKETIINWHSHPNRDMRFLVTVYDEINGSGDPRDKVRQMDVLRECMEDVPLGVPMRSSGKWGPNWGSLEKCE